MKTFNFFMTLLLTSCLFTTAAQENSSLECMKQFTGHWEGATSDSYFEGTSLEKMRFELEPDLDGSVIRLTSYFKAKGQDWQKNATGFLIENKSNGTTAFDVAWKVGQTAYLMNGTFSCENKKAIAEIDIKNGPDGFKQKGSWTLTSKGEFVNSFTDYVEGGEPRSGKVVFKKLK